MRIIITENQYRLLENKTKYDFGFGLFKDMVYERYPFIKKIVIDDIFYASDTKLDISSFQNHFVNGRLLIGRNSLHSYLLSQSQLT